MDGSESDKGVNWNKYKKADLVITNYIEDISNIHFDKMPDLTTARLWRNRIAKIAPKTFAKNMKLNFLDLHDNQLRELNPNILAKGTKFHNLDYSFNNINVIDKEITDRLEKIQKLNPQKSKEKIHVAADKNTIYYDQDLDLLNLRFWYDTIKPDSGPTIDETSEYKQYILDEFQIPYTEINKLVLSEGRSWKITTYVEKKQPDGSFEKVKELPIVENKMDTTKGSISNLSKGQYRIIKTLYYTLNSKHNFERTAEVISDTVTVGSSLGKVTGLKAKSITAKGATLTWKKVKGATGYEIFMKKGNSYKKIATTASSKYVLKKLKPGAKVQYKVRAFKKSGKITISGTYSNVVSLRPVPGKVKAKIKKRTITWKKVAGADGYQIRKGKKVIKTLKANKRSYKVKKKGTYTVRAFAKAGKKKIVGASVKVVVKR